VVTGGAEAAAAGVHFAKEEEDDERLPQITEECFFPQIQQIPLYKIIQTVIGDSVQALVNGMRRHIVHFGPSEYHRMYLD
jgi:hypothetical protein